MKTELHCHTTVSDGSMTLEQVLELAKQEGVTQLALTNHDTTKGLIEGMEAGKACGIEVLPGIEISAYDRERGRRVHILGYMIEPGHPALSRLCDPIVERRHRASIEMVKRLQGAGYRISWDQVETLAEGGTGVYKQHIMHALIQEGYTDRIYGELYRHLFARGGNGELTGAAYIPLEYVDARSAVQAVRAAGGVPVLAHPGQYHSFAAVPELVACGLQGMEVRHTLHGPNDEEQSRTLARHYGLIETGGTDFHGFYGEGPVVLGSKCPGPETVDRLKELAEANRKEVRASCS